MRCGLLLKDWLTISSWEAGNISSGPPLTGHTLRYTVKKSGVTMLSFGQSEVQGLRSCLHHAHLLDKRLRRAPLGQCIMPLCLSDRFVRLCQCACFQKGHRRSERLPLFHPMQGSRHGLDSLYTFFSHDKFGLYWGS